MTSLSAPLPPPRRFIYGLLGNLRAGARLLRLKRVGAHEFTVSFGQAAALLAVDAGLLIVRDWLVADADASFDAFGFYAWACYLIAALWTCALIARVRNEDNPRALIVVLLAALPIPILALSVVTLLSLSELAMLGVFIAVLLVVSERAVANVYGGARWLSTLIVLLAVAGIPYAFQGYLHLDPQLWYVADYSGAPDAADPATDAGDAESLLFDQPERVASAVDKIAPARAGNLETFFVGFAGDGSQSVFRSEALLAEKVFATKLGSASRSVELINDRHDRDTYPLATVSGLTRTLQLIGERMNEEDMLVLFLTSHGSREGGLAVQNGGLPLISLQPETLRTALDEAGIKWRIVVVSACYSGIFTDPLKDENTLVITASDDSHTSFGCADDRDLTYFGEAFLRDALPTAPSLEAAFETARQSIAARERAEKLEPSNPQLFVGAAIRQKLAMPE